MKYSKEIKIGISSVIAIIILIWGINFLKGKNIFSSNKIYYAVYNSVSGLQEYSPVTINGLKIGQVKKIFFIKQGQLLGDILITLELEENISIPVNSRAILYTSDIIGTKGIKIKYGDAQKFIRSNDTLISEKEKGMFEEFAPIQHDLLSLVSSIDSLVSGLNNILDEDTKRNLKYTLANVTNISYTLDEKFKTIAMNIESLTGNENIPNILDNLSKFSDSLTKLEFVTLINNANKTLNETHQLMTKLDSGSGTLSLLLNDDKLYNHLNLATDNLSRLLQDFKTNPDKYVNVSVFGGKKKVFYVDKEEYNNVFKKDITYKVQIKSSQTPISLGIEFFEGLEVEETLHKHLYIYTIGNFETIEDAQKEHESLLIRFPEAKVIAFKKEDLISLEKAKDI